MAKIKKSGFETVEKNYEELEKELQLYKKRNIKRMIKIVLLIVMFVVGIELFYAMRSFSSYEVQNTIERNNSSSTQYAAFLGYSLEYSNDGISCESSGGEIIWNQSFEMVSPHLEICGEYLVVFDKGGNEVFILTESGLQKNIETSSPIQTVCIASQGTVAILMKENNQSQVKLFDKKGNELANGKFYGEKGGFPVDIALSYDGTKLAVDMVDVSQGTVNTTISFYNFGSVGQSEIDNIVGSFTFEEILIPEIDYVSDSRMIAMGTGKMILFDGDQKPEISKEVVIEQEVLSYFHNEKYVGIVYDNAEIDNSWHIKVMDVYGRTVMENDISIAYDEVEFLSNGEICVTNANACEIFTTHSIKKFSYTFDEELYKIMSGNNGQNYTFVFKNTIEEVRLK